MSKLTNQLISKKYAKNYRYHNCYKCPAFYNGKKWECKGRRIEVALMCNWSDAK